MRNHTARGKAQRGRSAVNAMHRAAPSRSLKDRADTAQQLFVLADTSYRSSTSLLSCAFPFNISPGCRGQRCEPAVNGLKSHILYLCPSFDALAVTACHVP
jgi:hypothetical protein